MDQEPASGTATLPRSAPSSVGYELRPPARRRVGRAATKWFLVVPFVVLAPIAIVAWSAVPRLASPALVAEEAVSIGLTESARSVLVDGLAAELAERRDMPLAEDSFREVYERSMTQEWFDEQVLDIARELDQWLLGTSHELPDLAVDLVPVKIALASDPETMAVVSEHIGCDGGECAPTGEPSGATLAGVPDRVALLAPDADTEGLIRMRNLLDTARQTGRFGPLFLLGEFALLILLARRHARLRFTGGLLFVVGTLVVLATWLGPGWVGLRLVDSLPPDVPVEAADIAALVSWTLEPARMVAYWLVGVGAAAYVGSFAWSAMSRPS
jgi:hypothetical protein